MPSVGADMSLLGLISQLMAIVMALLLAPLMTGWVNQWRARLQNKSAPGLLQPYRVLHKLFNKESVLAGMQIGYVYRIRVANIPDHAGEEVFPTIELVDRLYPPPGQAARFPVPIELTAEELALALEGRFVTRVIYLEEPGTALPVKDEPKKQRYFEIAAGQDPLKVADQMGRSVAILRMGSRVPDGLTPDGKFLYNSPPLLKFTTTPVEVKRNEGIEEPQLPPKVGERQGRTFKRLPESQIKRR